MSTFLLPYVVPVKRKVDISQNFVAFSEYMNFTFFGEIFLGKIVFIEFSQVSKYVRKKMKKAKLKLSKVINPKYSKH